VVLSAFDLNYLKATQIIIRLNESYVKMAVEIIGIFFDVIIYTNI